MKIIQSIMTKNPCYTKGRKITVKGLMLHSVGCNQPKAQVFITDWNRPEHDWSCVHAFIDGNTGDVYQTLPWNHRGWHAGGAANNTHIGVEMCEPSSLKYKPNSGEFTCGDVKTAKAVVQRTYDTAVQLFAHLCKQYNLDPLADGVIISHAEGYKRKIAGNHGDPEHLWNGLGMGYTMHGFRNAVKNAMATEEKPATTKEMYRVQAGAYGVKTNAEARKNALIKAGFKNTFIASEDGMYKVITNTYSIKANAEDEKSKVTAKGFDAIIVTIRDKSTSNAVQKAPVNTYTLKDFTKEVQAAIGAKVDGIVGNETKSKFVTVSATLNNRHKVVKVLQKRLNYLGFDCGTVDGIAGTKFTNAMKAYQKTNKLEIDGVCGFKTWSKLLGIN